jgi:hypothetical protein
MDVELVWSGRLPGALVPGAQGVWCVTSKADACPQIPLPTIRVNPSWPFGAEIVTLQNNRRAWQFSNTSRYTEDMRLFGTRPTAFIHDLMLIADDGQSAYLIDERHSVSPTVFLLNLHTGRLALHVALSDNNQFDRHYSLSRDGRLLAVSGMGIELFEPDGTQVGGEFSYIVDLPAHRAAAGEGLVAIADVVTPISLFNYAGQKTSTLAGSLLNDASLEPAAKIGDLTGAWPAFFDCFDRLWVLLIGRNLRPAGVAVYASDGRFLAQVPIERFPVASERLSADSLIGIDRHGTLWWEDMDGHCHGTFIAALVPSGLAPGLNRESLHRTGLEPALDPMKRDQP